VFNCIVFDPPHAIGFSKTSIHANPKAPHGSWWGYFKTRREMVTSLIKAQKEFSKLTDRLCLKWNDSTISLWNILPLFSEWVEVNRKENKSKSNVSKSSTFWVTFTRKETPVEVLLDQQAQMEIQSSLSSVNYASSIDEEKEVRNEK